MKKKKRILKARRDYKDTLFRMLFSDRENLLSLYNAVNGTGYTDASALRIVTLRNAIYVNMKNDQAFLLDSGLNLYEHQSSWNPNMPLRCLFYVAREYESLIRKRSIYTSVRIGLPTPHFIVFYNGLELPEERRVLRLSESFQKETDAPELELLVTVLNISRGNNEALLSACRTLREYMQFVECVRKYLEFLPLDEAVTRAVDECIREGILAEFLEKNRAEAIAVSIFEYDANREKEKMRREEYNQGVRDGRESGLRDGHESGVREGHEKGIRSFISFCRRMHMGNEEIRDSLQKDFSLSAQETERWLQKL